MPLPIGVRSRAARDLEDAFFGLEKRAGLPTAEPFHVAVGRAFQLLGDRPLIGVTYPFDAAALTGIRRWTIPEFRNYLIFYSVEEDCVEIVRVLHGARDLEVLLEDPYSPD